MQLEVFVSKEKPGQRPLGGRVAAPAIDSASARLGDIRRRAGGGTPDGPGLREPETAADWVRTGCHLVDAG